MTKEIISELILEGGNPWPDFASEKIFMMQKSEIDGITLQIQKLVPVIGKVEAEHIISLIRATVLEEGV